MLINYIIFHTLDVININKISINCCLLPQIHFYKYIHVYV